MEAYTCRLPKDLRAYIIKNKVENTTQVVEIAQNHYATLTIKMMEFKNSSSKLTTKVEQVKNSKRVKESKDGKESSKRILAKKD